MPAVFANSYRGIGALRFERIDLARHRDAAFAQLAVAEFGVDRVTGPAGAVAARVAALDEKAGDDAMKRQAVVKSASRRATMKFATVCGATS